MIYRAIQNSLTPLEGYGGKKQFALGNIDPCELCIPFRGPQRVAATDEGYQWDMAFEFMARRKILSGLTYP
jgi:hypothetical protein